MRVSMKTLCKILFMIFVLAIGFGFSSTKEAKAENFTDNKNGTINVSYNNSSGKQAVVYVEYKTNPNAQKYYYKLASGNNNLSIPLTQGNGTYVLRIMELIEGNRYTVLTAQEISLSLTSTSQIYLQSSVIVNYRVTDEVIKKAASLASGAKSDTDKIKAVYNYVIKSYKYDYTDLNKKTQTYLYVPDINLVYKNKRGICYDISVLSAAMLRSQGVVTKVITGYTPNVDVYHAWNQVYNSSTKKWYTLDMTYDMCKYQSGVKTTTMIKKDSEYKDIVYVY